MQYKIVALGGTFDRLHKGHESFLTYAFSVSEHVIIGLTTKQYIAKYKKDSIVEPFSKRKNRLIKFLEKKSFINRTTIIPIDDIFGPTLVREGKIDALVVTEDSLEGAEKINQKRMELGLLKLPILVAPLAKEEGIVISSANIRKGLVDNDGKPFIDPLLFSKNLKMPEGLRILLHKPFGKVLDSNGTFKKISFDKIVTVGDITTAYFLKKGITPLISVVDFVVEREKKFTKIQDLGFLGNEEIIKVKNPPSTITNDVWIVLSKIVKHLKNTPRIILVEGEEDLLVLPLILFLPLGFMIFYGQPGAGFVQVEVTVQEKENARSIIALFTEEYVG